MTSFFLTLLLVMQVSFSKADKKIIINYKIKQIDISLQYLKMWVLFNYWIEK